MKLAAAHLEKEKPVLNHQEQRALALRASGEYMMRHSGDITAEVEDKRLQSYEWSQKEETLAALEAQIKALAEMLISQAKEQLV
ncbi:MAG TPA: hypothetical protein VFN35_14955 [Ktedonobacteraceae bacterium]|nr:hypothetical protein [Ktedonobacteraceae bacterium]